MTYLKGKNVNCYAVDLRHCINFNILNYVLTTICKTALNAGKINFKIKIMDKLCKKKKLKISDG